MFFHLSRTVFYRLLSANLIINNKIQQFDKHETIQSVVER